MSSSGFLSVFARSAFVCLLLGLSGPVFGQQDPISQAEGWFNGVTTLKARFVQISDGGSVAEGDFYLWRPYRSRFEYDPPAELVLITTERWLHVDEPDRRQVTSYPVSETPLRILFDERVRLIHDGITTRASSRNGITTITLEKPSGDDAGVLRLEFTEEPFVLRRWTITDAAGVTTAITFQNIAGRMELSPRLFIPPNYDNQP